MTVSSSENRGDVFPPLRHDVEYMLHRFGGFPALGYAQYSLNTCSRNKVTGRCSYEWC